MRMGGGWAGQGWVGAGRYGVVCLTGGSGDSQPWQGRTSKSASNLALRGAATADSGASPNDGDFTGSRPRGEHNSETTMGVYGRAVARREATQRIVSL